MTENKDIVTGTAIAIGVVGFIFLGFWLVVFDAASTDVGPKYDMSSVEETQNTVEFYVRNTYNMDYITVSINGSEVEQIESNPLSGPMYTIQSNKVNYGDTITFVGVNESSGKTKEIISYTYEE